MGGLLTWTILLTTFVNGVLCQQNSRDGYEGVLVPSQMRYRTPEQFRDMQPTRELATREILTLLEEILQSTKQQRGGHAIRTEESDTPSDGDQNETSNRMEPVIPVPMYVQSRDMQNLIPPPEYNEIGRQDKRGSYMALCHFKICNMGRKRTSKWTPWLRNENV